MFKDLKRITLINAVIVFILVCVILILGINNIGFKMVQQYSSLNGWYYVREDYTYYFVINSKNLTYAANMIIDCFSTTLFILSLFAFLKKVKNDKLVNIINVIFYSLVIISVGLIINRLTRYVVTFEPIGEAIIWILSGICLFCLFGVVISIISLVKIKKEFDEVK